MSLEYAETEKYLYNLLCLPAVIFHEITAEIEGRRKGEWGVTEGAGPALWLVGQTYPGGLFPGTGTPPLSSPAGSPAACNLRGADFEHIGGVKTLNYPIDGNQR